jgi:hypothetical protein
MRTYGSVGVLAVIVMLLLIVSAETVTAETVNIAIAPVAVDVVVDAHGRGDFEGPGLQRLNPVGAPNLPWQVLDVLLPPEADLASVSVGLGGVRWEPVSGNIDVPPAPPEMCWRNGQALVDWPDDQVLIDGRNPDIYEADADYPVSAVKLIGSGQMRLYRLAQIGVALFKWNPVTGQLQRLVRGELQVTFTRRLPLRTSTMESATATDAISRENLRQIAVNFATMADAYDTATNDSISASEDELPLDGNGSTYVILTTNAIQTESTALTGFVAHKTAQNFVVQVVTETEWGGGSGDTAAENIRGWLQANYLADDISHVLLIGDPDPAAGNVPMKMTCPRSGYDAPTDYYYADLTGDWDLDGDGNYGEFGDDFGTDGVDRYWELLVGRIPYYGDIIELDGILTRIMAYQNTPVEQTEWRKNVLLPMDDLGDWYPLSDRLGEDIRDDILSIISWPSHRIYDSNTLALDPPPETMPCTEDNVVDVWSQNPFGLMVWFTHGSATGAADVINSNRVDELDDTYPSFTFQVSCHTAQPEDDNNLAYALLREGGICTIGATRSSWSLSGHHISGEATIEGMGYEYTKRIAAMGMSAGRALNMLRQQIAPDSNYAGQWMNYVDCNVYGDPDTILYACEQPVHNITQDKRYPVIQSAVDEAVEGDEIVLDPGTYAGPGNEDIDFSGKNLILRSIDPNDPTVVAATIIDALGEPRVFRFTNSESAASQISGLTITGGYSYGMYVRNASPSVFDCVISGNNGIGIYTSSGDMIIEGCTFEANGGGIKNSGGSPQIVGCHFNANTAYKGGGIDTSGGEPFVSGCTFTGNTATSQGGGLYGTAYESGLIIENCLFSGNTAQDNGGGLCIMNETHVVNTVIVGNTAINDGGGVMAYIRNPSLTNCSIINNRADRGGGLAVMGTTLQVDNTILWDNTADIADNGDQIAMVVHDQSHVHDQPGGKRQCGTGWDGRNLYRRPRLHTHMDRRS